MKIDFQKANQQTLSNVNMNREIGENAILTNQALYLNTDA